MKNINMYAWATNLIENPERSILPVMTYSGLSMINRAVIDIVTKGEDQSDCINALAEEYPSCAAITVMDLSVEAEAFGCEVQFHMNEVPTLIRSLLNDPLQVHGLKIPKVGTARTGEYIKAAELSTERITDRPVFGSMIGPYSLGGRLVDISEFMTWILIDPENAHLLLQKCTDFLKEYAKAFKLCGANGLLIAEPAAGLLSPELCQEFSSNYVKQIVEYVQDESFLVVLHNCGKTDNLVESMISTGAKAFHFGNAVKIVDILYKIPNHILVMGNLDPAGVIRNASHKEVYEKTLNLLQETFLYKNFILSSGCDIPPFTPQVNIKALFNAWKDYNTSISGSEQ